MDAEKVIRSSQTQATAAWIDHLNQLRLNQLLERLASQDINFESALQTLQDMKTTITERIIEANRGGTKGMHGFIAEAAEAGIGNARKLIVGAKPEYIWVNNNGPADLLRNGIEIQQKFVRSGGHFSLEAIREHLSTYPDFLKNGGKYQIPKDFYDNLRKLLSMSPEEASKLANSSSDSPLTYNNWKWVQEFFKKNNIDPNQIEPSVLDYSDAQAGRIDSTIKKEGENLRETDQKQRDQAYQESKPSLEQGVQVTVVSAALEGGMNFCLGVAQKLKSGKKLSAFTAEDWKEVGIDTAKGTTTGAVRGASVYVLTNFTASPAAVANSVVTASFGIAVQAKQMRQGTISKEDFLVNSEVICLDAAVSAVSSIIGQVLIPVPILGALIGNTAGMFMYDIAKQNLSAKEQSLIKEFKQEFYTLDKALNKRYLELLEMLKKEFQKYLSLIEWAFSPDVNIKFYGSVALADYVGVSTDQVLRSKQDIDQYFMS